MKLLDEMLLVKKVEAAALCDIENQNVYGSSYIVKQNGKTLFKRHFGVTGENKKAVDDKTLYRLCSMTKPVTAFATLLLVDRNQITLDDKIKKYLPQFKDERVKIVHLLSHTSGICDYSDLPPETVTEKALSTVNDTVELFMDKDLLFAPLSTDRYSGTVAFDFLVAIIEKVTGEEYTEFLKREVFIPCGMNDSGFIPTKEQWSRFIDVNGKVDGKCVKINMKENCVFEKFPCTHTLGGAGLFSSLDDYSKFAEMLLNGGVTADGKRLLKKEVLDLMSTPVIDIENDWVSWGLGVRVVTDKDYPYLPTGIYGWSGAYGSHFWVDPENKITAVFMKNAGYDGGAGNKSSLRFEQAVKDSLI
ncbi:MAG: beta-lactamase family protein [Clostridia bacterium]|nr:beta-lactamase family protein [Clostridia bacterium]